MVLPYQKASESKNFGISILLHFQFLVSPPTTTIWNKNKFSECQHFPTGLLFCFLTSSPQKLLLADDCAGYIASRNTGVEGNCYSVCFRAERV